MTLEPSRPAKQVILPRSPSTFLPRQVRSIARRMVAQWGFANAEMGNAPVRAEAAGSQGQSVRPTMNRI